MAFNEKLPKWDNVGIEPPEIKKTEGWQPTEKPPAQWFNWLLNRNYKALEELRSKAEEKTTIGLLANLTTTIKTNIVNALNSVNSDLVTHMADKANPHGTTKSHVGLGSVQNYGIATQAEAESGTVNNKYITPLRVKQAIDANKAIVESGSNSNGSYIKFTDGTMICYHTTEAGNIAPGGTTGDRWLFPTTFKVGEIPSAFVETGTSSTTKHEISSGIYPNNEWNYTGFRFIATNNDTSTRTIRISLQAIGRWK